jgi:hypothetical protein
MPQSERILSYIADCEGHAGSSMDTRVNGRLPEDEFTLLIVSGSLCVGAGSDPIWGTAL